MLQWINDNKDWFLSGAGIFVISTIVALISAAITARINRKHQVDKRKKLEVTAKLDFLSIPPVNTGGTLSRDDVKVSYKGTEYENLGTYHVHLNNVGKIAIENLSLVITFPSSTDIIRTFQKKSLSAIEVAKDEKRHNNNIEIHYTVKRLESNDTLGIGFLINPKNCEIKPTCNPRGVDDIDYSFGGQFYQSDVEKVFVFIGVFLLMGFVPMVGAVFQGVMLITMAPYLATLANNLLDQYRSKDLEFDKTSILHYSGHGNAVKVLDCCQANESSENQ